MRGKFGVKAVRGSCVINGSKISRSNFLLVSAPLTHRTYKITREKTDEDCSKNNELLDSSSDIGKFVQQEHVFKISQK